MDRKRMSRHFDPPSPKRERETSPKRKRTDDVGEVVASLPYRRILPYRIDAPATGQPPTSTDNHEKRTLNKDVDDFLQHCNDRVTQGRSPLETTSSRRLLHTIAATQVTQAQTSHDLLELITKLHDWARHLNTQEQYLHRLQVKLIDQQQELSKKLLDAATEQMETDFNLTENLTEPAEAEQNRQLRFTVGVLETNIEILISELILEREARAAAETKLKAKESIDRHTAISLPKKADGNEVDFEVPVTDSGTPSPVASSAGSSILGGNNEDRIADQGHSAVFHAECKLVEEEEEEDDNDVVVRRCL